MEVGDDGRLIILSDSDNQSDSDEDTLFLLRHSNHVRARDVGFNVHAVAIGANGTIPGHKQNGWHNNAGASDVNTGSSRHDSSSKMSHSGFGGMGLTENTNQEYRADEFELEDYQDREISYRHTAHRFLDPVELERNQIFREKKKNAILNVVLLGLIGLFQSVGFLVYFADISLINISDIKSQRIGSIILLVSSMLSVLVSHAVINAIGQKWSIFIGCIGAAIFTTSRFFGSFSIILPAAILAGVTIGPLLVGIIRNMTNLAHEYSDLSGKDRKATICYFCGILQTCTLFSPAFSVILRYVFLPSEVAMSFSDTHTNVDCFVDFCWTEEFGLAIFEQGDVNNRTPSDAFRVQALLGSFLACSLGAALLAWLNTTEGDADLVFEERQEAKTNQIFPGEPGFTCSCKCSKLHFDKSWLVEPLRMFGDRNMMLVAPLCVYLGAQQYLFYTVYVQTFTQCSSQMFHAITTAITISLVAAFSAFPIASIIAQVGKVKVILPGLACHMILLVVMVTVPSMGLPVQYVMAAFWGATDAIIHVAIIVIISEVFSDDMETATVCLRFYQISGYLILVSLLSAGVCNRVVLIATICLILLAVLCYVAMEIKIRLEKRESREMGHGSQYVPLLREASWLPLVNPVEVRRDRTESLTSRIPTIK